MKRFYAYLLLIAFSCTKEKPVPEVIPPATPPPAKPAAKPLDTIKPHPYLPAFPGSWWKYTNSTGATVTYKTEPNYVKDFYSVLTLQQNPKFHTSDTVYVPVYLGRKIWGRQEHVDYPTSQLPPLIPVVSDSLPVGYTWSVRKPNSSHSYLDYRILSKDTAIIIAGKTYSPAIVLQLGEGVYLAHHDPTSREYYAKDIGMVRKEMILSSKPDSIYSYMNIIEYHIAK
jgi:hypothetical protein